MARCRFSRPALFKQKPPRSNVSNSLALARLQVYLITHTHTHMQVSLANYTADWIARPTSLGAEYWPPRVELARIVNRLATASVSSLGLSQLGASSKLCEDSLKLQLAAVS